MKTVLKSLFWRIEVEDDGFKFRNMWGEKLYKFSDITNISVKARYYIINLVDRCVQVDSRSVANSLQFLSEAASHGVEIVEKT